MGGSIPPPGCFGCCCCSRATCNLPCLLCVRLWCYAPYRRRSECAVRCFLCLWVWGILVALIKLAGFLVGLRLRASPSCFAFGLRLRASPSGFAFGLRLRASPSGFAFGLRLRASPSGIAFGHRLRASPSGPPEATTRLIAHGRCPGSFPDSPQNTHGTSRSYLPRNTAVRRLEGFLLHLLCFTSSTSVSVPAGRWRARRSSTWNPRSRCASITGHGPGRCRRTRRQCTCPSIASAR